ncbi:hypothetical protein Bbelb_195350 [Branchiostoma belcheri]|nr:hypothetical protein Bbelb_195350 [Branchiostoma belcheri]
MTLFKETTCPRPYIDWDRVKVLDQDSDWFARGVREAIQIRRQRSTLNKDRGRHYLKPAYDCLLSGDYHIKSRDKRTPRRDLNRVDEETNTRATLCILSHYGIPPKIINMIKVFYSDFQAQVSHEGDLSEPFSMTTGARQGCLLSPLLFITALDWIMRETTEGGRTGIQWTLLSMLYDLDFADDLALLSYSIGQMRGKMQKLEDNSGRVGLTVNATKTKAMRVKTTGNANQ